jgi:hypothetical protein
MVTEMIKYVIEFDKSVDPNFCRRGSPYSSLKNCPNLYVVKSGGVYRFCPIKHYKGPPVPKDDLNQVKEHHGLYNEINLEYTKRDLPSSRNNHKQFSLLKEKPDDSSNVDADIISIQNDTKLSETTKKALVDARRGQGAFRNKVFVRWNGKCAVSGCGQPQVLRASHMKPWSDSSNDERLDPRNGLPLTATLDALFDSGLVSFVANGQMLISIELREDERDRLGLPNNLRRTPDPTEAKYLAYHRERRFRK